MELVRQLDIKAVSFQDNTKTSLQTKMIVDLLKRSIEENKIITKDDILNLYADWSFYGTNGVLHKEEWVYDFSEGKGKYVTKEVRRNDLLNVWNIKSKATQWFKTNLGGAILKGKILAIPVIQVD